MIKKLIIISVIFGLLSPILTFAQFAQNQPPTPPETLEEAQTMGLKILKAFPQALKGPWQEALRIWGKMADIFSNCWNSYVLPWLKSLWQKITVPFKTEIERRKPIIEEEFKKEKEEAKEEIKTETSKAGKTLWERLKELIK